MLNLAAVNKKFKLNSIGNGPTFSIEPIEANICPHCHSSIIGLDLIPKVDENDVTNGYLVGMIKWLCGTTLDERGEKRSPNCFINSIGVGIKSEKDAIIAINKIAYFGRDRSSRSEMIDCFNEIGRIIMDVFDGIYKDR